MDQNNEVFTDTNLDLSTAPQDLASKGDTFNIDDKNRLLVNDKPVTLTTKTTPKGRPTKFGLILEQANSEEVCMSKKKKTFLIWSTYIKQYEVHTIIITLICL